MFINADELNLAINRISNIASLDKKQPGILFNIFDDHIDVYYNYIERAIINTVRASVSPDEIHGKVVFDYKRITDILKNCKSSGIIKVGNIELTLKTNPDGTGTANISVVKKIDRTDGNGKLIQEPVSTNTYDLSWTPVEKLTISQKILNNPACEDMFSESESVVWDKADFINIMSNVSGGDAKTIYLSKKYNGAFAVNTNNSVLANYDGQIEKSMQFSTNEIKAIISILGSLNVDQVKMNTIINAEGKPFANLIFTEDHTLSIYSKSLASSPVHISTINKYTGINYKMYNFTILNEILSSNLKDMLDVIDSENGIIDFRRYKDGKVVAIFKADNTGASVSNTYEIVCDSFNSMEELGDINNADSVSIISIKTNLKVLYSIVSKNKFNNIAFDVAVNSSNDNVNVRIGFIDDSRMYDAILEFGRDNNIEEEAITDVDEALENAESNSNNEADAESQVNGLVDVFAGSNVANDSNTDVSAFDNVDEIAESSDDNDAVGQKLRYIISKMTTEDKLNIRDRYISIMYFSVFNRA